MIRWDERIGQEYRPLSSLCPHEKPCSWRIWKITKAMRAGITTPIIYVAPDGMILDGHHRHKAAMRVLGKDAIVPVEVSYPHIELDSRNLT